MQKSSDRDYLGLFKGNSGEAVGRIQRMLMGPKSLKRSDLAVRKRQARNLGSQAGRSKAQHGKLENEIRKAEFI